MRVYFSAPLIVQLACALAVSVAGLALVGWMADLATLKSLRPDWPPLYANAALCFVMAGLALMAAGTQAPYARIHGMASIVGFGVTLIGLLTVTEYVLGWDLGIDQLFFRFPGRMSIESAVSCALLGVALLCLHRRPPLGTWVVELCSAVLAITAVRAGVEYVFGFGGVPHEGLSLNGVAAVLALSAGVLASCPDCWMVRIVGSDRAGGAAARHLLPVLILAFFVLGWLRYRGEQLRIYGTEFGLSLMITSGLLLVVVAVFVIAARLNATDEERERSHERIWSLNNLLSHYFAVSIDAVILHDESGRMLSFNHGAEQIFGYPADEALGQPLDILIPERLREAHRRQVSLFSASPIAVRRMSQRGQILGRRKDGTEFSAEASIGKMSYNGATVFAVTLRDVTEQRKLEAQLRQSQKMEAVGQLAGGVAHDFNNLLTVILGNAGQVKDGLSERNPVRARIEEIEEAGRRAAALTRQLLAFARRQMAEPRALDLNAVTREMDRMLRRLIGEDVELVTLQAERLGTVWADPGHIEQVLVNLAVNARDAMPNGGKLTIETSNTTLDAEYVAHHASVVPGEYVMLAVSDTGHGIAPEVQEHIFEPFFTTKEPGKGTGLGLATCYGIVKQSGGWIWVYSEPGQGTTIKVYLPRIQASAEPLVPTTSTARPRGTETILVVEDEAQVANIVVQLLRERGYRVLEAANGLEALRVAEAHQGLIDLLVTDVVMPQVGGRELAERLRAQRPQLKVLFTSGYTSDAIVHHGVLERNIEFLSKPFDAVTLGLRVREVLDAPGPT